MKRFPLSKIEKIADAKITLQTLLVVVNAIRSLRSHVKTKTHNENADTLLRSLRGKLTWAGRLEMTSGLSRARDVGLEAAKEALSLLKAESKSEIPVLRNRAPLKQDEEAALGKCSKALAECTDRPASDMRKLLSEKLTTDEIQEMARGTYWSDDGVDFALRDALLKKLQKALKAYAKGGESKKGKKSERSKKAKAPKGPNPNDAPERIVALASKVRKIVKGKAKGTVSEKVQKALVSYGFTKYGFFPGSKKAERYGKRYAKKQAA